MPEDVSPFKKWAGQPSGSDGMGGATSKTDTKAYDPTVKPGPFAEIGASGLAQYGGFVREEFLPQLSGDNARKVYREMYDNDPIVGAVVFAIQMLVRKVEWRVEPAEAGSVEEIVEERMQERMQAYQERMQAQQQRVAEAQAGLAGNALQGNARGAGPGGKAAPPAVPHMGASGLVGPAQQGAGMHEPISPTPPNQAGPNAPMSTGTNDPEHTGVANTEGSNPLTNPGTNPGGGPAQAAALEGNFGLGSEGKPDKNKSGGFAKAAGGGSGGGGGTGGIDAQAVGTVPIDPETNAPMEFGLNDGPQEMSPEARKAEELAVFVETCFHDMADSWADSLAQIMTMVVFGFAFHEIVYKKRNGPNPDVPYQGSKFSDGKVGWANLAGRAQETLFRWEFDDNGNILGFWQLAPPKFQLRYIPLAKAVLFRTTSYKNNPEGRSIFRSAYRPWFFKKRVEEYESIGVERDLAGLPMMRVPYQIMTEAATPEEKASLQAAQKLVRNVRANQQAGLVIPTAFDPDSHEKVWDFELLSASGGSRAFDTDKIITRYDQRIAMTSLADVLLLGHDSVGARSLGETKVDLFTSALEAWLNSIADDLNTQAIPKLMQINGEDPAMCPRLTHGKLAPISLEEIASLITALSGAGADLFPDTQLEDFVREEAGLPPKAASQDL